MTAFLGSLGSIAKGVIGGINGVFDVGKQVFDIFDSIRSGLNPTDTFLPGDLDKVKHAIDIVNKMQLVINDGSSFDEIKAPTVPSQIPTLLTSRISPIVEQWQTFIEDDLIRPFNTIRLGSDPLVAQKLFEGKDGNDTPLSLPTLNEVASTDPVVSQAASDVGETLKKIVKVFPLTLPKIDSALDVSRDPLKRTVMEKRIIENAKDAVANLLLKMQVGAPVAAYNLVSPVGVYDGTWNWARDNTSFLSQFTVISGNPTTFFTNGGTGITWDSDSRGFTIGNTAVPFTTTLENPGQPGYLDGNHQIELSTVYQDQADLTPTINPTLNGKSLPKDSIYNWYNTLRVNVEVEWSTNSIANSGYIELLVFISNNSFTSVEKVYVYKPSSGSSDSVTAKGIAFPMDGLTKVWFRLVGTTVTAFSGNSVSVKLDLGTPYGKFKQGSTLPYNKITYRNYGSRTYQSLASNTTSYLEFFGTLEESSIDDPIASVLSKWNQHLSIYGNVFNTLLAQIVAYSQITDPVVDLDRPIQKILGNDTVILSDFIPIQRWLLHSSAWVNVTSDQKSKILYFIHDLFLQYAKLVDDDSVANDVYLAVSGLL